MVDATKGTFRLSEQIGGWAVFADISLHTVSRTKEIPLVSLEGVIATEQELVAITFGAIYALQFLTHSETIGIVVTQLHTNLVDTTPMALAFATCQAVFSSLRLAPTAAPYFERKTRSFVFPARGLIN